MNDCKYALEIMNQELSNKFISPEITYAFVTCIETLEKQIPKKAKYHHKADGDCVLVICPNCESMLTVARHTTPLDRYCKECGQHYIVDVEDWSVEE